MVEGEKVTRKDREQMISMCRWAAVEKDPIKFEKLACELNDLVAATLRSVQPKPKSKEKIERPTYGVV